MFCIICARVKKQGPTPYTLGTQMFKTCFPPPLFLENFIFIKQLCEKYEKNDVAVTMATLEKNHIL